MTNQPLCNNCLDTGFDGPTNARCPKCFTADHPLRPQEEMYTLNSFDSIDESQHSDGLIYAKWGVIDSALLVAFFIIYICFVITFCFVAIILLASVK